MLTRKPIALRVTPAARAAISKALARSELSAPVPGIVCGNWNDGLVASWVIGVYESEKLPPIGWILETPEQDFYTFQDWVIGKLEGATLDFIEGQYSVRPESKG